MQAINKNEFVDNSAFEENKSDSTSSNKDSDLNFDDLDARAKESAQMLADLDKKFASFNQAYHDMNKRFIAKLEKELGGLNAEGKVYKNRIMNGNKKRGQVDYSE